MIDERQWQERLEIKVDKLDERIDNIDITLAAQHESLKAHMHRSDVLEQQLEPIKKTHDMIAGSLKVLTFLGVLAGLFDVWYRLFRH